MRTRYIRWPDSANECRRLKTSGRRRSSHEYRLNAQCITCGETECGVVENAPREHSTRDVLFDTGRDVFQIRGLVRGVIDPRSAVEPDVDQLVKAARQRRCRYSRRVGGDTRNLIFQQQSLDFVVEPCLVSWL